MTEQEFLTVEDALTYLGVKRAALYKYIKQGRLTVYKRGIGNRSYLERSELDAMLQIRPADPNTQKAA